MLAFYLLLSSHPPQTRLCHHYFLLCLLLPFKSVFIYLRLSDSVFCMIRIFCKFPFKEKQTWKRVFSSVIVSGRSSEEKMYAEPRSVACRVWAAGSATPNINLESESKVGIQSYDYGASNECVNFRRPSK